MVTLRNAGLGDIELVRSILAAAADDLTARFGRATGPARARWRP